MSDHAFHAAGRAYPSRTSHQQLRSRFHRARPLALLLGLTLLGAVAAGCGSGDQSAEDGAEAAGSGQPDHASSTVGEGQANASAGEGQANASGGESDDTPASSDPQAGSDGNGGSATPVAERRERRNEPGPEDFGLALESEDDLVDTFPLEVVDITVLDDDSSQLVLAFEMGSHYCYGLHVDLDESDIEVAIGLSSGRRPGVSAADCQDGVYAYTTEVDLSSPLGDRPVVRAEPREPETDQSSGSDESADSLIGRRIEEGVEWAMSHDIEWRLLSYDGEPSRGFDDTPNPERISFTVERDMIVAYEWS